MRECHLELEEPADGGKAGARRVERGEQPRRHHPVVALDGGEEEPVEPPPRLRQPDCCCSAYFAIKKGHRAVAAILTCLADAAASGLFQSSRHGGTGGGPQREGSGWKARPSGVRIRILHAISVRTTALAWE